MYKWVYPTSLPPLPETTASREETGIDDMLDNDEKAAAGPSLQPDATVIAVGDQLSVEPQPSPRPGFDADPVLENGDVGDLEDANGQPLLNSGMDHVDVEAIGVVEPPSVIQDAATIVDDHVGENPAIVENMAMLDETGSPGLDIQSISRPPTTT